MNLVLEQTDAQTEYPDSDSDVYDQLEAACLPLIKHYHDDLLKWDRECIEASPGVPFLHWTNEMGTHIVMLQPESEYPAKGVEVPYLFGTADRWHLVRQIEDATKYHVSHQPHHYCHYFDGQKLRFLHGDGDEALNIAKTYCRRIVLNW